MVQEDAGLTDRVVVDRSEMPELADLVSAAERQLGLSSTLPLGLHGDGVPCQVKHSLAVMSWNCPSHAIHGQGAPLCLAERLCLQVWVKGEPHLACCVCYYSLVAASHGTWQVPWR